MRLTIFSFLFLFSSVLYSEDHSSVCFQEPENILKDLQITIADGDNITADDVKKLKQKWYSASKINDIQDIRGLLSDNFVFGLKVSGQELKIQDRKAYLRTLKGWFVDGMLLESYELADETIQLVDGGQWAIYRARVTENIKGPTGQFVSQFRDTSYVINSGGKIMFAGMCGVDTNEKITN